MLDKINEQIIRYKKRDDRVASSVLVLLKAELIKEQKAKGKKRTDQQIALSFYRQLEEELEVYMKQNISAKCKALCYQLLVVEPYIPKLLEPDMVDKLVEKYVEENNLTKKDMGKLMKAMIAELGHENSKTINQSARKYLK